jgi:hypothetical protein
MRSLINKLLPHTEHGLSLRMEGDTIYASGFREGVDLEALAQEIIESWLEMARREALLLVRDGKEEKARRLRPADFNDLMAKLQLGRIKPEEQQTLNAYYDALDALEAEANALSASIAEASVADLNAIRWPEWVNWTHIPENPKLEFEATSEAVLQ